MSWQSNLDELIKGARAQGQRLADVVKGDRGRVMELMRPNLGPAPQPLRRVLEPLVAVVALGLLGGLVAAGGVSLLMFMLAGALIYGILTQVFGLELEMAVPGAGR